MSEVAIKKKLVELSEVMSSYPAVGEYTSDKTADTLGGGSPASSTLEDVFDTVRLQTKYLLFDVEATRRENRYLRKMLEIRRGPKKGTDDGKSDNDKS